MKSCMYSSTVVKMNTYDATARPKAVRPREVRGSHSHAADADGIKINMNMFICILGDFDLQYYYVHSRTGVRVTVYSICCIHVHVEDLHLQSSQLL